MPESWNVIPPPPPQAVAPRPAEIVALRAIVTALVAGMALMQERAGVGTRQSYLNMVSEACQRALLSPKATEGETEEALQIKREAIEEVNKILGGLFDFDISASN
jgi:hypothetical protein